MLLSRSGDATKSMPPRVRAPFSVKIFPRIAWWPEQNPIRWPDLPEIRFIGVGGFVLANVKEYVHAGVTGICLGSAFLANTLAEQGERGLVNEMKEFVKFIARAKSQK